MDSEVIHVNLYKYIVFQPKHELKMVKFNQIILIALKLLPFVCLRGSLPKHSQLCEGSIYTANVVITDLSSDSDERGYGSH